MDRLLKVNLEKNRRIIMISDIHGEKELLVSLLNKINFNSNDYLFIIGDIVGRGKSSLATLRYVKELSNKENVYVLAGNCDLLFNSILNDDESIHDYEINHLHELFSHYHSIIHEMCNELNIEINDDTNFKELVKELYPSFKEEMDFIRSLPKVIESEDFIFVHAGISDDNYQNDSDYSLLRYNEFNNIDHRFKKYVVVGHYPTLNYCDKIPKLNPLLNYKKNIISIDGGNNIIPYGQLNALVYDKDNFFNYYEDKLPLYEVKQDYFPFNKNVITINFNNKEVQIIEEKEEFYNCYHEQSNTFLDIDKSYIYQKNGKYYSIDTTNYNLEVNRGDFVRLIKQYKDVSFVKKSGIIGFIPNSVLK